LRLIKLQGKDRVSCVAPVIAEEEGPCPLLASCRYDFANGCCITQETAQEIRRALPKKLA